MKKEILSIQEYNSFIELLNITSSIQKIYSNLFQLEACDEKDSYEYRRNLKYLKISLEVEEELYKKVNRDFAKKIQVVIKNFLDKQNSEVIRRILNNIKMKFTFDELEVIELLPNGIVDPLIGDNLEEIDEEVNGFISSSIDLYKMFRNDVLMASLIILNDFLNDDKYKHIRKKLLSYKYNVSFKNKSIEANLLDNAFEIPGILNVISNVLAHFYSIKKQEYISLKENFYLNGVLDEIESLLVKSDSELQGEKGQSLLIIEQCLLRGYFLLMEAETIKEVSDEFHYILGEEKYLVEHFNDKKSELLIINSFKMIERDKSKKLILTIDD